MFSKRFFRKQNSVSGAAAAPARHGFCAFELLERRELMHGLPPGYEPPPAATVVTGQAGVSEVTVNWEPVSGATNWDIYRATSPSGSYSEIAGGVTSATNSYENDGLQNGTLYWYEVAGVNNQGTIGAMSAPAGGFEPQLPPAASTVTGKAGVGEVTIDWNPISGATHWDVYRATSSGGPYIEIAANITPSANSYEDTGVKNGTLYWYEVAGVNSNNTVGAVIAPAGGFEPQLPPAASTLTGMVSDGVLTLKWSPVSGATHWDVFSSTSINGQETEIASNLTPANNSFSESVQNNGAIYYFEVEGVNSNNTIGAPSNKIELKL